MYSLHLEHGTSSLLWGLCVQMHVGIGLVSDSILVVFLVFHTKKTTEFLVDSVDMKKHLEKYCLNYETFWDSPSGKVLY
jgi:hypothetical protein